MAANSSTSPLTPRPTTLSPPICPQSLAIVVSVNYCLVTEHCYPAQYDDGFDILTFLDDNKSQVLLENADLSRCFLAEDSAGVNLAHHVVYRAAESNFQKLKA
ncbi:hypothetical protein ACSBR1_028075 [Camellia fascicularis]